MGDRLAAAFHRCGWRVLRVDTIDRLLAQVPARSLFDWRQQLARGRFNVLSVAHGDVWPAPGLKVDAPGFATVAARYDVVVLDTDFARDTWVPMPGADNCVVIDVPVDAQALRQAFRLIKTLCHRQPDCAVSLIGDPLACRRLQEAATRFLDATFARTLFCPGEEVEPFAALAARMAGEEKGRSARR